jgi:hypothetical protein
MPIRLLSMENDGDGGGGSEKGRICAPGSYILDSRFWIHNIFISITENYEDRATEMGILRLWIWIFRHLYLEYEMTIHQMTACQWRPIIIQFHLWQHSANCSNIFTLTSWLGLSRTLSNH